MMNWLSKNKKTLPLAVSEPANEGILSRMARGLSKTRGHLGRGIMQLFVGKKHIDPALEEALEALLLGADCGLECTQLLLAALREAMASSTGLVDHDVLLRVLKQCMVDFLISANAVQAAVVPTTFKPFVVLLVGVNGAGKTTTVGKLASYYQHQGLRVMLAAGDTFRTAAVEQLQAWGGRNDVPVVAQHTGADSASVIYDAFSAARARGVDVLIGDTAGRLHTQAHLMDELKKVKRVLQKLDDAAPHEVFLVLDGGVGQNALMQARQFHQAIGVTGIILTKLDGTAKGGIVFALAHALNLPIRYLGLGEGLDDLRVFDPIQFVDAIFQDD